MLNQTNQLQNRIDTGFVPIGLDMPYRVFISEDPIRFWGGINFYAYVKNNPMNWRDPRGLSSGADLLCDILGLVVPGGFCFKPGEIEGFFPTDTDNDGLPDFFDPDDDNDGLPDDLDPAPTDPRSPAFDNLC